MPSCDPPPQERPQWTQGTDTYLVPPGPAGPQGVRLLSTQGLQGRQEAQAGPVSPRVQSGEVHSDREDAVVALGLDSLSPLSWHRAGALGEGRLVRLKVRGEPHRNSPPCGSAQSANGGE